MKAQEAAQISQPGLILSTENYLWKLTTDLKSFSASSSFPCFNNTFARCILAYEIIKYQLLNLHAAFSKFIQLYRKNSTSLCKQNKSYNKVKFKLHHHYEGKVLKEHEWINYNFFP